MQVPPDSSSPLPTSNLPDAGENATIVQVSETNSILIVGEENSSMAEEAVTSALPMLTKLRRLCRGD